MTQVNRQAKHTTAKMIVRVLIAFLGFCGFGSASAAAAAFLSSVTMKNLLIGLCHGAAGYASASNFALLVWNSACISSSSPGRVTRSAAVPARIFAPKITAS